jgi:hypothetical protein
MVPVNRNLLIKIPLSGVGEEEPSDECTNEYEPRDSAAARSTPAFPTLWRNCKSDLTFPTSWRRASNCKPVSRWRTVNVDTLSSYISGSLTFRQRGTFKTWPNSQGLFDIQVLSKDMMRCGKVGGSGSCLRCRTL